jgi:iron complex outermembrane receptor protein
MNASIVCPSTISRSALLASASGILAIVTATPAAAQDAAAGGVTADTASQTADSATGATAESSQTPDSAAQPSRTDRNTGEEIIVTGIRGSLQRNLDIKREASGVVDVISAEDIGKFPDSNVASALQRLPGVSIQRSGARGDATGVTVRGFGGGFNDTLYDGRHISTASGNRGVDFSTIGADFVGQISVYKTPDVTLSTSAIGATIDVQLPKPFDRPGFHVAAMAAGSIQSRDGNIRPTAGLLVSDTFANDTLGILADVAYTRRDTEANHVFIPGWVGARFAPCQTGPINLTCIPTSDPNSPAWADPNNRKSVLTWFPQQNGAEQATTRDERLDGRIAIQWQPNDDLLLTLDDNFTRQTLNGVNYSYAAWFAGDDLRNVQYDSNGTVVDFNQFGTPMDFNAGRSRRISRTNQIGANLKWDATENLRFDFDAAYARSVLNPGRNGYNDNMDIGYGGYNNDPNGPFCSSGGCVSTVLGAPTGVRIDGSSSSHLPIIHDVGPANDLSRFLDTSVMGSHVIVRINDYNTDTVKQAKFTGAWESGVFRLRVGGQYIADRFHLESANTFTNNVFFRFGGYGAPSGRTGALAPLPSSIFQGDVSTAGFIPGYNNDALAPGFLRYDIYQVYEALEALGRGGTEAAFDPGSVLNVREKTFALFVSGSFDTEIAGMPFHFNAGFRYEDTRVNTSAFGREPTSLLVDPNDPTLITPIFPDELQNISRRNHYSYLLPSFDLKLEVTPDLILRFDASRTLTRPNLADLRPTITFGSLRRGSLAGSGGNPDLTPYLSDNYDLGAEWYYARNSYLAANGFVKRLTNFIVGGVTTQTVNDLIDPFTGQLAQFQINARVNGPEATVRGLELAWQHVFGDSGFGFNANATIVDTNRDFDSSDISGGAFAITGLANSANFVGFYERHGFQIRGAVNWRDEYLLQLGQGQGGTFGAEPVYVDQQLQIDASASYEVTNRFTVFGEVTNINNSTFSTHGRFSNQPLDIWHYGRRFTAGIRFRL